MRTQEKINMFGFLFCGFVIFIATETVLNKYSEYILPSEHYLKKSIDCFEKIQDEINIIFLGHSQVYYGINPAYIKLSNKYKVHNFAFVSEPIETNYYKLSYYLQKRGLKNLKLVVIDASSIINEATLNTVFEYSRYYNYLDILFNHRYNLFLTAMVSKSNIIRLKPIITNINFSFSTSSLRYFIDNEHLLDNGYCKREYSFTESQFKSEIQNYIKWDQEEKLYPDPIKLRYLNRLISTLHNRKINVIFILPPVPTLHLCQRGQYNSLITNHKKHDFCKLKIQQILKNIYPDIPVFNYNDPNKSIGFTLQHFSDRGHLNYRGSKLLSTKISNDLELYFKNTNN
ncbi:MAG: hypothetical protein ACD_26C00086G0001 [uncultured bacterium]|nr:MAG: hypothetical protein ACD_26C00086G0001 [uncultured bacterium]